MYHLVRCQTMTAVSYYNSGHKEVNLRPIFLVHELLNNVYSVVLKTGYMSESLHLQYKNHKNSANL